MTPMLLAAAAALLVAPAAASDAVRGAETVFTSPNGVAERCVRIAPMPGAKYDKDDLEEEQAFCAIDLYAPTVALCPKTWSTSPGMMVYDLSEGPYAGDRARFERDACKEGKGAKDLAKDDLAKFKPTMNAEGTSGTFSPSPLLYYHFSRYFGMDARVPVAVWRSMDRQAHLTEVARPAIANSGNAHSGRMNHEGWRALVAADENPDSYSPTDDLFTADRKAIYGVMVQSPGSRYGAEVNGTRKSGWGEGQSRDFQQTPPFLALRSTKPLADAIAEGLVQGRRDPQIAKDLGPQTPPQQMAYWMREISEIVLMDFIFSQQDRIGNIDFEPYYYWVANGKLEHKKAKHHEAGDGEVPADALLLRRTRLNDNDAAGRVQYANFAKSTGMLEALRRFDADIYRKLMALDADLQAQGPIHGWLVGSFGLDTAQVKQIATNANLAAGILRGACERGELVFDLSPKRFFVEGAVAPETVDCAGR